MNNFLSVFLDAGPFIPHGHCYLWQPSLVWLHLLSDSLIALAYYSIPLMLFYFVRKRQDLPFSWVFLLFATFIVSCGTTHILEIWTLWHPTYWLSGGIKAVTAIVSVFTAYTLVPQALKIKALAQKPFVKPKLPAHRAEFLFMSGQMSINLTPISSQPK